MEGGAVSLSALTAYFSENGTFGRAQESSSKSRCCFIIVCFFFLFEKGGKLKAKFFLLD